MKIAIIGTGAMGSLFAGYLAQCGEEVWAYDIWKEHVEHINKEGLLITCEGKERRVSLKATSDPTEPGQVDLAIVFVKYGQTRQALKDSLPMIGPHTTVLTLQNGIGNVEILQEELSDEQILFGLTTLTSELLGPGHIEESFQGKGETYFWPLTGRVDDRAKEICSFLNKSGIHTQISADVEVRIWKKLIVNACYNTLSAIVGLKVGDLVAQPELKPVLEGTTSEIVKVARRKGVPLDNSEAQEFLRKVGVEAREHFPSMLIDVKNKKKTEIECLNGTIVREGTKLGIPTPFNSTLYGIVRLLEDTYDKRS